MKLLLDQGLPRSAVRHLAAKGIVAQHVGDVGLAAAEDEEILEAARNAQEIVVTLDADFHRLLAMTRARAPSVIRVRIERLKGDDLATLLQRVIATTAAELAAGAAVTVTETNVRVRSLPIGNSRRPTP